MEVASFHEMRAAHGGRSRVRLRPLAKTGWHSNKGSRSHVPCDLTSGLPYGVRVASGPQEKEPGISLSGSWDSLSSSGFCAGGNNNCAPHGGEGFRGLTQHLQLYFRPARNVPPSTNS